MGTSLPRHDDAIDEQAVRFAMAAFDLTPVRMPYGRYVGVIADAAGIPAPSARRIVGRILSGIARDSETGPR